MTRFELVAMSAAVLAVALWVAVAVASRAEKPLFNGMNAPLNIGKFAAGA